MDSMVTSIAHFIDPYTHPAKALAGGFEVHTRLVVGTSNANVPAAMTVTNGSQRAIRLAGACSTESDHCNQQFSITAVTTSAGAVTEYYANTAYGLPTILDASCLLLTAQRSSLGNRSSIAGRFMGRDPIGFADGWNIYEAYFSQSRTDPTGLLYKEAVIYYPHANINAKYGNDALTEGGPPFVTGIDWIVTMPKRPCCCCVTVIRAKDYNSNIVTYILIDLPSFTIRNRLTALGRHEERRRRPFGIAFDAYLGSVGGYGAHTKAIGTVFRRSCDGASAVQVAFPDALRKAAFDDYVQYMSMEIAEVEQESDAQNQRRTKRNGVSYFDGYIKIFQPPPRFGATIPPLPTPDKCGEPWASDRDYE